MMSSRAECGRLEGQEENTAGVLHRAEPEKVMWRLRREDPSGAPAVMQRQLLRRWEARSSQQQRWKLP